MIIKDKRCSWSRCEKVITKLTATYNQTSHWWQETGRHGSYGALSLLLFASVARKPCLRDIIENMFDFCPKISRHCEIHEGVPGNIGEVYKRNNYLHDYIKIWRHELKQSFIIFFIHNQDCTKYFHSQVYTLELPLLGNLVIFIGVLKVETFIE